MRTDGRQYARRVLAASLRATNEPCCASHRATRRAGPTHPCFATFNQVHTAANITSGCTVYAGYDRAPFASGRDDSANGITYAKQGAAFAWRADQQITIGRNRIYETLAGGAGTVD